MENFGSIQSSVKIENMKEGWYYTNDVLPVSDKNVLICMEDGTVTIGHTLIYNNTVQWVNSRDIEVKVIMWKKIFPPIILPDFLKGKGEGEVSRKG